MFQRAFQEGKLAIKLENLSQAQIPVIKTRINKDVNSLEALQLPRLKASLNNLPTSLTSFVGREKEIKEVKGLLTNTRLLTLTGAAGCGKTRLALEVAATLLEMYSDGVWLVELADLVDSDLVSQTVVSVLEVPSSEVLNRPLNKVLIDFLRPKSVLLILDNCEHLIEACTNLVAELLRYCPRLKILATSRETLRSEGTCWTVPPLSLPPTTYPQLPAADLIQYDAVKLFIERAKASQSNFVVTERNALPIAQVCRQLDGLPLAIELAIGWVDTFSVEKISEEVQAHRFQLLTEGKLVGPRHHETLQATIDWSYDKLPEREKLLFQRLSVFAGEWSLEAVEAVCTDERVEEDNVSHLLRSLLRKSLVVAEKRQEGEKRYRFLESIRDYSSNKLKHSSEAEELLCRRHRDWFLRLLEQAEPALLSKNQKIGLERLEIEQDNLRAAFKWAFDHEADKALRLAWLLSLFLDILGHRHEAREVLETALKRRQDAPIELYIPVLSRATLLAVYQADCNQAQELAKQLLDLSHNAKLDLEATRAQLLLGQVMCFKGEFEIARSLFQECLKQFERLNSIGNLAWCLHSLGMLATDENDFASAQEFFKGALGLHREAKDDDGIAQSLVYLAFVMHKQADRTTVPLLLAEAHKLLQRPEGKNYLCWYLHFRGRLSIAEQNFSAARTCFHESLKIFQKGSDKKLGIIRSLLGLSYLSAKENRWNLSICLLSAEEAQREEMGLPPPPDWKDEIKFCRDGGLDALGQDAFDQAWEEGRATSWQKAIEYVLPEFNH